jgi:hypothetical protein
MQVPFIETSKLIHAVALLNFIWEVPSSDIGWDIDYTAEVFSSFPQTTKENTSTIF